MAADIEARITDSVDRMDGYVKIVTVTILVIGSVTALLVLLGVVTAFLQWAVASHVLVSLIWAMGFITWCTVTLCLLSTLFAGDTSAAMWQVSQQEPMGNSTMQAWLPCAKADDMQQALNTTAAALSASITQLNASIATNCPQLLTAVNASGICNPYADGTSLTYNLTSCLPGTMPPTELLQTLAAAACSNSTCHIQHPNGTHLEVQVPEAVLNDLKNASSALKLLYSTVPALLQIANCTYVKQICEYASGLAQDMERDFNMLWWGFIVVSIASMLFALALPIYIFRCSHPLNPPHYPLSGSSHSLADDDGNVPGADDDAPRAAGALFRMIDVKLDGDSTENLSRSTEQQDSAFDTSGSS
ncbi:hypothetical protein CLOP_g22856 [Closterium sp. NIES-67]|nr:hypothetical protein CLOP_g22856 [Closterium sp. NIES-67]